MPLSNSQIRRYTPPTCTLEVLAQSSPLSRWMGKSVLKDLNFELHLDDPQVPDNQKLVIRGDRDQLEALSAVVSTYVQELLQQSPDTVWKRYSNLLDSTIISPTAETQLLDKPSENRFAQAGISPISPSGIRIEPGKYFTHKLFLGSLGQQISTSFINLNLLQLFDLATALDEYAADVMALPKLTSSKKVAAFPLWAPIAAVLVLGVGLTWQRFPQLISAISGSKNQVATTAKSTSTPETIAVAPSPATTLATPLPALTPPDALPSMPTMGNNTPIVTSSLPPSVQSVPTANVPPNLATSGNKTLPSTTQVVPGNVLTATAKPNTKNNVPSSTQLPPLSFNPQLGSATTTVPNTKIPTIASRKAPNTSTAIANLPPSASTLPTNDLNALEPTSSLSTTTEANNNTPGKLTSRIRESRQPSNQVATNSTIFDTPQVAEARDYLKKRWQPPEGLQQVVEYSLIVGVDGTIERILPLNKPARDYVDRTGMPLIGEPFVSANKNGQSIRIRAVLSPDGKVQTFPEKD